MLGISLDIESFGACKRGGDGRPLPPQDTFHAPVALARGVPRDQLVQTVAITEIITEWPSPDSLIGSKPASKPTTRTSRATTPPSSWPPSSTRIATIRTGSSATLSPSLRSGPSSTRPQCSAPPSTLPASTDGPLMRALAKMTPGQTGVLTPTLNPGHRRLIRRVFARADLILGMNLPFDLTWLLTWEPSLGLLMKRKRPILVDVSVLNSLDHEARPERGLKDLGQILLAYNHVSPFKDGFRFTGPADPDLHLYNGKDTHVSILAAATLARRLTNGSG